MEWGKGKGGVGNLVVGSGATSDERSSRAHNLLEVRTRRVALGQRTSVKIRDFIVANLDESR